MRDFIRREIAETNRKEMITDPDLNAEFVRQFAEPTIASHMATDYRLQNLGRVLALMEGFLEKDSVPQVRSNSVTTADWLGQWARMRGLSERLVAECYVDYWFLYTVSNTLGHQAARAGVSMLDFIADMNHPLAALRKLCPGQPPPRLLLSPGPGTSRLLEIDTPRHLATGMVPGFVQRLAKVFVTRCRISMFHGRKLPCWQLVL